MLPLNTRSSGSFRSTLWPGLFLAVVLSCASCGGGGGGGGTPPPIQLALVVSPSAATIYLGDQVFPL